MASDLMIVAALGRPFKLGMLYDARKDQLLRGSSLWDPSALAAWTRRSPQPHSDFKMSASDSTKEKSTMLELQGSIRASAACGLVKGEGSAQYMHNKREFEHQSRVTLRYKATTHVEQLSLSAGDWDKVQNRDMMENGLATHVVTGIEYGGNAFFVFDSHLLEASEVKEFSLKVKVVINLLFFSVEIDYEKHLTEEQKSVMKKLTVKFHSDFLLEHNPATLPEAVQVYKKMGQLLGEHGENTVPMRVWMMPLKHLSPKAAQIVRNISLGLVIETEDALEELDSIKMRCNNCLSVSAVGKFPQFHHQLQRFYKLCDYYSVELKRQMSELCPAIREGTKSESDLRNLFKQRDTSPFSQDQLTQWLQDKEREINVVQSCLDIMKSVPVLSTQAQVDQTVLADGNENFYGLVFTSLGMPDTQLEEMSKYLSAVKAGKSYEAPEEKSAADKWYYDKELLEWMKKKSKYYYNVSNVFVTAIIDKDYLGFCRYHYTNGMLEEKESQKKTEKFSLPEKETPE